MCSLLLQPELAECGDLIRTSIHDEYDLMLFWHMFLSILRV